MPAQDLLLHLNAFLATQTIDPIPDAGELVSLGISLGYTYQVMPDGLFYWFVKLYNPDAEDQSGNERQAAKRAQLDSMREETYHAAQSLRAAKQHHMANKTVLVYLAIIRAEKEEFPRPQGMDESADLAIPAPAGLPVAPSPPLPN